MVTLRDHYDPLEAMVESTKRAPNPMARECQDSQIREANSAKNTEEI